MSEAIYRMVDKCIGHGALTIAVRVDKSAPVMSFSFEVCGTIPAEERVAQLAIKTLQRQHPPVRVHSICLVSLDGTWQEKPSWKNIWYHNCCPAE